MAKEQALRKEIKGEKVWTKPVKEGVVWDDEYERRMR